jgi:phosphoribosyl 1,2-cyclic phosphodiesterase
MRRRWADLSQSKCVDFDHNHYKMPGARCGMLKQGKLARGSKRSEVRTFQLTFLGTRGEIDIYSRRHRRHSALLIQHKDARIMIDCGADWRRRIRAVAPTAIILTYTHRDHAAGLADGVPCPVYATKPTLELLRRFPLYDRRIMPLRRSIVINGVTFKAYPVEHSIRAPAVGYRICVGRSACFCVPDIAALPDASGTLHSTSIYIGDGATLSRSMVRQRDGALIGHASIVAQLDWCASAGVKWAIFTHCGSAIVRGNAHRLNALIDRLGRERGIKAQLANDGDRLCRRGGAAWQYFA